MDTLNVPTRQRTDFVDITAEVQAVVRQQGLEDGVVTLFVPHTTAGLTCNENWDPDVKADMEQALDTAIPWSAGYRHGEGNAAAHVKATLAGPSLQVIVSEGKLQLGTWQGIFLCEFDGPRSRKVWIGQ